MAGMAGNLQTGTEHLNTRLAHRHFHGPTVEHHLQLHLALHQLQLARAPAQIGVHRAGSAQVQGGAIGQAHAAAFIHVGMQFAAQALHQRPVQVGGSAQSQQEQQRQPFAQVATAHA
ncbi:hypothetical protein D3C80_1691630 [compost metagenome]